MDKKFDKELIAHVGGNLEEVWKKSCEDEKLFPQQASSILKDYKEKIQDIPVEDYFSTLFNPETPIGSSNFGDASITLWESKKFYMEVIFWQRMWTSIHEHGFSGAFLNLKGARFVAAYRFEEEERIEERLRKGILKKEKIDEMKVGDIRPILRGMKGIHRTMSIQGLGVSFVIRTKQEKPSQFSFFSNGMAYCAWRSPKDKTKKICDFLRILGGGYSIWETICRNLSTYELLNVIIAYYNDMRKTEYEKLVSILQEREYGKDLLGILASLRLERNIRHKIFHSSSLDLKKEFALMLLEH